ncbi:GNAT family N-acetyltransferase [Rubripirellula reticaptiva]|uniref:N-acetyltransferase domain-containing protein n=1 Tax=Rubripirellula reticaptiva TaxID=2528013 RepID=A0A5C6EEV5_9BACT|nr:GNAT family N-acetyltransferase [Rubripirellula reticaptiva]TWU46964.1 hypothetical protein Poly59_59380 [Rubripirellula reticaptiva]
MTLFHCREIIEADWPSILCIQSEVYYDFAPESEAVMRSKVDRGRFTSFVAVNRCTAVVGYCLAHPFPRNRTAVLGELDISPVERTTNLFLHDLAVQEASAGCGVARAMFNHLTGIALSMGYQTMSLVAVQKAAGYWTKMGFAGSAEAAINQSYKGTGAFMTKSLTTKVSGK